MKTRIPTACQHANALEKLYAHHILQQQQRHAPLIVAYHRERVLPSITSFKNATQFMYETRFVAIGQLVENSIGSKELLDG